MPLFRLRLQGDDAHVVALGELRGGAQAPREPHWCRSIHAILLICPPRRAGIFVSRRLWWCTCRERPPAQGGQALVRGHVASVHCPFTWLPELYLAFRALGKREPGIGCAAGVYGVMP